jgi:hypothetical protein
MSAPLPGIAEAEAIKIADDGTQVKDLMHRGIIACAPGDTVGQVAKIMVDKEIHAVVVMDGGKAVGVVSQTDMVLARQGRTSEEARAMKAKRHHDPRLRHLRRRDPAERGGQPDDRTADAPAGRHRERSAHRRDFDDRRSAERLLASRLSIQTTPALRATPPFPRRGIDLTPFSAINREKGVFVKPAETMGSASL